MASRRQSRPALRIAAVGFILAALYGIMVAIGHTSPELGLDLRGGTSVVLTPLNKTGVTDSALQQAVNIIDERVDGLGVSGSSVTRDGHNVLISVPGKGRNSVLSLVGETAQLDFRPVYCPDATSGCAGEAEGVTAVTATTPTPSPSPSPSTSVSPADRAKIGKAKSGAKASPSTTSSAHPDVVSRALTGSSPSPKATPGASRSAKARASTSAKASAAASAAPTPSVNPLVSPTPSASSAAGTQASGSSATPPVAVEKAFEKLQCTKSHIRPTNFIDHPSDWQAACAYDGSVKYILGPSELSGTAVSDATASLLQGVNGTSTGEWIVQMDFKSKDQSKVYSISSALAGTNKPFAIVLDGVVESAPVVDAGGAFSASAEIEPGTGAPFSESYANQLANVLKYGALPLSFSTSDAESISASLGHSSLDAGLLAGALGLALVILYCFLYYRALGIVTVVSLSVSAALIYALVSLAGPAIGETLDLAGVAGLIVSIGITADSFVVFYERLKDEVREGKSVRSSVERGWVRARRTIISADVVSLLAAVILYLVSIGDVRGFAFTLGLSTLLDLFVVFFFTKPLVTLAVRLPLFSTSRASGLSPGHAGIPREA